MSNSLSIVTVGYKSAARLETFFAAASAVAPDAELILVDNASNDDGATIRAAAGADQIIACPTNIGFGRACNLGATTANGGWLLFANPDVTLERLPVLSAGGDGVYGLGAALLAEGGAPHKPAVRAEANAAEDALNQLWWRVLPRTVTRMIPKRRWPARWASGASLLCRRSEFLHVGGFDERFFMYFEDRDLAHRYRMAGFPLRVETDLQASHGHGESSSHLASWVREFRSLVSWIEYRGIWHGAAAAADTAGLALGTLRRLRDAGARFGGKRAREKARGLDDILAQLYALDEQLPPDMNFHPGAQAALRFAIDRCGHGR